MKTHLIWLLFSLAIAILAYRYRRKKKSFEWTLALIAALCATVWEALEVMYGLIGNYALLIAAILTVLILQSIFKRKLA